MKKHLSIAFLIVLFIGVLGPVSGLASAPSSASSVSAIDRRHAKKRRPRRAGRIIYGPVNPYAGNIRILRVKRLSPRQRRAVYRRLLDIQLN